MFPCTIALLRARGHLIKTLVYPMAPRSGNDYCVKRYASHSILHGSRRAFAIMEARSSHPIHRSFCSLHEKLIVQLKYTLFALHTRVQASMRGNTCTTFPPIHRSSCLWAVSQHTILAATLRACSLQMNEPGQVATGKSNQFNPLLSKRYMGPRSFVYNNECSCLRIYKTSPKLHVCGAVVVFYVESV